MAFTSRMKHGRRWSQVVQCSGRKQELTRLCRQAVDTDGTLGAFRNEPGNAWHGFERHKHVDARLRIPSLLISMLSSNRDTGGR